MIYQIEKSDWLEKCVKLKAQESIKDFNYLKLLICKIVADNDLLAQQGIDYEFKINPMLIKISISKDNIINDYGRLTLSYNYFEISVENLDMPENKLIEAINFIENLLVKASKVIISTEDKTRMLEIKNSLNVISNIDICIEDKYIKYESETLSVFISVINNSDDEIELEKAKIFKDLEKYQIS